MKTLLMLTVILIAACTESEILPKPLQSSNKGAVESIHYPIYASNQNVSSRQLMFKLPVKPELQLQEVEINFKEIVNKAKIEKKQRSQPNEIQYLHTYLGKLKFNSSEKYYHVISEFYTVQAAQCKHGNSRLVFLDEDKKYVKEYVFDMPDELPVSVIADKLIFRFDGKLQALKMNQELPETLCLPVNKGCF